MAVEKSRDVSPDWEHSSTLKRGIIAMLLPYYEILLGKKKISKQIDITFFLDVF